MLRQVKSYLYVLLHSRGALSLLVVCLIAAWLLLNDAGDAIRNVPDLENRIEQAAERGNDYLAIEKNHSDLQHTNDLEEIVSILRTRQIIAAPYHVAGGMLLLLFLLPGVTLTPGLTRSRGIGRELQFRGKTKTLLSRMLLSWVFCFLLSTGMYYIYLQRWTDTSAASVGLLTRYYVIIQFFVLAGISYGYFVNLLFRHTAVAAAVMILAEVLLHHVIPGLYVFQPFFMIPYYNSHAYNNTTSLVGVDCPPATFLWYCAVCLIYVVICTFLAFRIFRRREENDSAV